MPAQFNLGDHVWLASVRQTQKQVQCPDCFGKKFLRIILGDDTEVSVACSECELGYSGSQGTIRSYDYEAWVEPTFVEGLGKDHRSEESHIKYNLFNHYGVHEENVFAAKDDALVRATVLLREHELAEAARLTRKEKPNKSWSQNVSYHRSCVRRAEHDLTYHKSRLAMALVHKKEEKTATQETNAESY